MSPTAEIASVNLSVAKGTPKHRVDVIVIDARGVVGDAHAGGWHRQVSLLAQERIEAFGRQVGRAIQPGEFAENLTTRGLDLRAVAPLDRFVIGDVELEVTQIGKACHGKECAIFREVGQCLMPTEGLFCRGLRGVKVRAGDLLAHRPRPLKCCVITLSDRASRGEYEDRSGPEIQRLLTEFFAGRRWHVAIEPTLLPDEADQLRPAVTEAVTAGADLIFTTGGTGVGPRDIAPETVAALCDKLLPGVMEHIRAKFGAEKPTARLSRSVAGVIGTTQVYTLPGSVRAVREYLGEILPTLEHLVFMLHGIDVH